MTMPCYLPIESVRPTQLYLSSAKLSSVVKWFDFDDPDYDPLPVFEHEREWYLADGHTRAFCAHLAGAGNLLVERDKTLREEYDFDVYRACIEWCADENVATIEDIAGRVVSPDTYEEAWIDRCRKVAND